MDGALFALERGVQTAPKAYDLWIEYGELRAFKDNRPLAIHAASISLNDPLVRPRALKLIANIAQKYFKEGQLADALKTVHVAHGFQEEKVELAWLRAQISEATRQPEESKRWLQVVLDLEPNHRKAICMLQKINTGTLKHHRRNKGPTKLTSNKRKWWSREL